MAIEPGGMPALQFERQIPNSPRSVLVVIPDLNIPLPVEASLRRAVFRLLAVATDYSGAGSLSPP